MAGDETRFGSSSDLANAMRRAEAAHGEHEKRTGQRDADWPTWYAAYIVARERSRTPEEAAKDAALHMEAPRHLPPLRLARCSQRAP